MTPLAATGTCRPLPAKSVQGKELGHFRLQNPVALFIKFQTVFNIHQKRTITTFQSMFNEDRIVRDALITDLFICQRAIKYAYKMHGKLSINIYQWLLYNFLSMEKSVLLFVGVKNC